MATLPIIFPIGTVPSAVSLLTLSGSPAATTTLPVAFTGPVTLGDGRNEWTATFAGAATSYAYTASATINGNPSPFSGTVAGDGVAAAGQIIDQSSLTTFLGSLNLAIQTNQNNTATTVNAAALQQAINAAEARVKSKLAIYFKIPLAIGGVAIKSVGNSIALPLLQAVAHQYCGFLLNKWRAIQSVANQTEGAAPAIDQLARQWEKDADAELQKIVRWVWGYSDDVSFVDLDFAAGVSVGVIPRIVPVPVFAGATVDANGLPERRIINPVGVPWWAVRNPFCFVSE